MPGLIAFRRRWSTGSDDLVVPGFFLFVLHVTLFIIISIILGISPKIDKWATIDVDNLLQSPIVNETIVNKATCASEIRNFCFGYLSLLALAAVLEVFLIWFSTRGTILDPTPREWVEYLVYARIFLGVIELIYSVTVSVIIGKHWHLCAGLEDIYDIQLGIVIVNIIIFLIVVTVGYCVFDPNGGKYYKVRQAANHASISSTRMELMRDEFAATSRKTWLSRLSNCFCCVSNNKTNIKQVALDEVSALLDEFFRDYDFVMSDIIAGLTLLRHKQQCAHNDTTLSSENNIQEYMCGRPISPDTNFIDLTNPHNRKQFEDVAYYGAYSLAVYGPLFYWIENTGSGLCGILQECLCGENPTCTMRCCRNSMDGRSRDPVMRGNTGCGWVLAAIRKSLMDHGIGNNVRVVYISMDSDVYKQPFFVTVDHNKKSIVVTVRGTLAEADALTDLVACPTDIPCEGNDGTWKAHKGMVEGARFIKNKLLFEDMALSLGFGDDLAQGTRDYSLVLVGHSLGAGVASILALLLRPEYPNLKCYAYSPPGGLLSYNAMLASQAVVQTVILGKDIIARCGISQLEHLRDEIIDLFKHTNLPKYRIILGNLCGSLKHRHNLLRDEQISAKELRLASRRVNSSEAENMSSSVFVASQSEELYPPGRIYHLVYSSVEKESSCLRKKKKVKKYYLIHADNVSDFGEIMVSHQMISHHLPQEVFRCMKKVLDSPQKDPVLRCYAQSATLPFAELPANRNSKKVLIVRNNKDLQIEQEQPQSTTVTIEAVGHSDSETQSWNTEGSAEPFLNRNSNHNINDSPDVIDYIIASSNSLSSSSSCDIKAPLAKPDSFTLSVPAQSPVNNSNLSVFEDDRDAASSTQTDITPEEENQQDMQNRNHNSISFTDPQASSTPAKDAEENLNIPLTASHEKTQQDNRSELGNTENSSLITKP